MQKVSTNGQLTVSQTDFTQQTINNSNLRKDKIMNKKIKALIIVAIIALAVFIFVAATDPVEYWVGPLVVDTNVQTIQIDKTILQGDIEFTIDRLEVGDKYSTIYYEMSPFIGGEFLKGTQLYQGDVALKLGRAPYSQTRGGAICFDPVKNLDDLTLYVAQINDYIVTDYDYELKFIDNVAEFDAIVDGKSGVITVYVEGNGIGITTNGIADLKSGNTSTRTTVPIEDVLYNIDTGESGGYMFSMSNLPTHLKLIHKKYIIDEQPLKINIS